MTITNLNAARFKVGYIPPVFPRDPTEVGFFLEHMILGQILETLVVSDAEGKIIPGVAERWEFSSDQKSVTFFIDENRKFSNGTPVTAKDAFYSLNRHRTATASQSHAFLQLVSNMQVLDTHTLKIDLTSASVAFIKILSRDQLGILPNGWKFDSQSTEPYMGSGPYRMLKNGASWHLNPNPNFPDKIAIGEWEILFSKNILQDTENLPVADFMPVVAGEQVRKLKMVPNFANEQLIFENQISFLQSTAWWFPQGKDFANNEIAKYKMEILRSLIQDSAHKQGYTLATGVIPRGVAGHILESPPKAKLELSRPKGLKKEEIFRVGIYPPLFNDIALNPFARELESRLNIRFEFIKAAANELDLLRKQKADAIVMSYFGGFNDPQGFLFMLDTVFQMSLADYLGELGKEFKSASSKIAWNERASEFNSFGKNLLKHPRFVPAWTFDVYSVRKPIIKYKNTLRYSPRFTDCSL